MDRDLTQPSIALNDTEKGMIATSLMGGIQANCEISKYNEDVDKICNYCREADSIADHIKWVCKEFQTTREEIDAEASPNAVGIPYIQCTVRHRASHEVGRKVMLLRETVPDTMDEKPRDYSATTRSCTHQETITKTRTIENKPSQS